MSFPLSIDWGIPAATKPFMIISGFVSHCAPTHFIVTVDWFQFFILGTELFHNFLGVLLLKL